MMKKKKEESMQIDIEHKKVYDKCEKSKVKYEKSKVNEEKSRVDLGAQSRQMGAHHDNSALPWGYCFTFSYQRIEEIEHSL